jgi:hypothetical protein
MTMALPSIVSLRYLPDTRALMITFADQTATQAGPG